MTHVLNLRRADARARLDSKPDIAISGCAVDFNRTFETIEDDETFCPAPADAVDAGRRLLTIDAADGVARWKSDIWSSEIHLMEDNVFHEALFVNAVLLARRLNVTHVYMDDTSCTNTF